MDIKIEKLIEECMNLQMKIYECNIYIFNEYIKKVKKPNINSSITKHLESIQKEIKISTSFR